ncbi:hypothetical protein BDE18_0561 [Paracoccus pantotrophus]|uniref:Uncharacterized protein n=1 Tax=Paracoccus pantotrophus TaxID=82367 RepID=A0ABX9SF93_PARPN|nr:hypothetical protein BDE18_0561 [Paracoccus pantotrophus]
MHPLPHRPERSEPARRQPLSPAPPDRKHVCPSQGLASDRNPPRSLPHPVSLGLRPRRDRHLWVVRPGRSPDQANLFAPATHTTTNTVTTIIAHLRASSASVSDALSIYPEQELGPSIGTESIIPVKNPIERLNKEVKRRADVVGVRALLRTDGRHALTFPGAFDQGIAKPAGIVAAACEQRPGRRDLRERRPCAAVVGGLASRQKHPDRATPGIGQDVQLRSSARL